MKVRQYFTLRYWASFSSNPVTSGPMAQLIPRVMAFSTALTSSLSQYILKSGIFQSILPLFPLPESGGVLVFGHEPLLDIFQLRVADCFSLDPIVAVLIEG